MPDSGSFRVGRFTAEGLPDALQAGDIEVVHADFRCGGPTRMGSSARRASFPVRPASRLRFWKSLDPEYGSVAGARGNLSASYWASEPAMNPGLPSTKAARLQQPVRSAGVSPFVIRVEPEFGHKVQQLL